MNTGIYEIKNILDGKRYIGSAHSFCDRFAVHLSTLKRNIHMNVKLQRAWNKYGGENFEFNKLLVCSKQDLLMYEQILIDGCDAVRLGYNISPTAGNTAGVKASDETRKRLSVAAKNRENHHFKALAIERKGKPLSDEHKLKISNGSKGKRTGPMSEETKKKLSIAHTGKKRTPHSEETRKKIAASNTGKKHTKETIEHLSFMQKNRTEEHQQKLTNSHIGMKHTDEAKLKMSKSQKNRLPATDETRAKIGAAHKGKITSDETRAKISAAKKGKKRNPEATAKGLATRAAKLAQSQQESAL